MSNPKTQPHFIRAWASHIKIRKLFPGFHPGIILEVHDVNHLVEDRLANFLRIGKPNGPWSSELITPKNFIQPIVNNFRAALHIHVLDPDFFSEILMNLIENRTRR